MKCFREGCKRSITSIAACLCSVMLFACGGKGEEEAAKIIQSRVEIYVSENR